MISRSREEYDMNLMQKLRLRLSGRVYIGHKIREGWRKPLPFYLFKCPVHGIVEDYPHGYSLSLECPLCGKEAKIDG